MRYIYLLIFIFLISSCEELEETESYLDYKEYLTQGWNAFEAVNLDQFQDSTNAYYYQLALEMFDVSAQAIDYAFSSIGPHYEPYNGTGWTQLYYANEFMDIDTQFIRDSLRQKAKLFFNKALFNLDAHSLESSISSQDRCNTYAGLSYTHYYSGLSTSIFDSSLTFSSMLINECPDYSFEHDEFDFRSIHYLRGKIYLFQNNYTEACIEINSANGCDCDVDNIDIDALLDCFDQFSNGE
mgnify:CR=1 FL=1